MRKVLAIAIIIVNCQLSIVNSISAQSWPTPQQEAKAGTRWWWLGSAVDRENLEWNLSEYARAGIGTVEIAPLYGVQGNERNDLQFLSPQWMSALKDVQEISNGLGIEVDMSCGTGWPFGGPHVSLREAACKAIFHDSIVDGKHFYTVELGNTRQKVKRAAPGGEGWVIDHFDRDAVHHYLEKFEQAFSQSGVSYPHTFFNDSYEVYHANWTPTLFDEFQKRRGYDLRQHLPELLGVVDDGNKVLCDYRETLSDLLYENFTQQWVEWAHRHGVKVRSQAHGSPANLLDLYAAVDIPEIEGFGLSEFGIKGLRTDLGMTKKNFCDVPMLKYASSAAHVMGKPLTSSETFTWLTEHFRTSLSQMKPDLDLMFTCGVNHMFFHGSCYTPKDDPWPGWKFYASIDMSPTNSIWRDAPYMMKYIERCQSFLQMGEPDNDFLVYLPVRDMWRRRMPVTNTEPQLGDDLLMRFDIHGIEKKTPEFIHSILAIDSLGYDCDYISDRQLAKVRKEDGMLVTEGGTCYRALIIPTGTTIDANLKSQLDKITPYVIYGEDDVAMKHYAMPEHMRTQYGLRVIRRRNDKGHHYFIANLTPNDICGGFDLATGKNAEALWFNPMSGNITPVEHIDDNSWKISLRSGESIILQTFDQTGNLPKSDKQLRHERDELCAIGRAEGATLASQELTVNCELQTVNITTPWTLTFTEEVPWVKDTFVLNKLQTWESLSADAAVTMGTGVYTTTFKLSAKQAKQQWQIDLGDVRESARVYINDRFIGCAWAVPFVLDCGDALRKGKNVLRIEVTNLPANRISDLDRRHVPWRKMKDLNMVDINYQKTTYNDWAAMPSGLNSDVRLIPKR